MMIPLFFDAANPDRKRILVVEDNTETQLILKIYLRDFYEIDTVTSAVEGLKKINDSKYDLLVLDINLPGELDGNDVLIKLKDDPGHKMMPILVVTAYALKGDKEKYLAMGASAYLSKPVERQEILKVVKGLIG